MLGLRESRIVRAAWAGVLALVAGCAPASESELLRVHRVAPDRLEPGHRLSVRGFGFPPGRAARVRISGTVHRPGAAPREAEVELEGRAVSSEEVEARFTEGALEALGGRGTIRGRVRVLFEAAGEGWVVGRSPRVVLDVMPASTARLGDALARRRDATELAARVGLSLGEEAPDAAGLPVETVEEGSIAARAGIVAGDRLIALEDVRLHALSDLVPPPGASEARAELARVGEAAALEVRLPLGVRARGVTATELRTAQAALVWLLLALCFLAPLGSIVELAPPRPSARTLRDRLYGVLRGLVAVMFFAAVAVLARHGLLCAPLETILFAALAARAGAASLAEPSGLARVRAVLGAITTVALAAIGLGCAAVMAGTTDLTALEEAQGALPWEWAALSTPAGPILVLLAVAGGSLRSRAGARLATAMDELVALVLAALVGVVLLGGSSLPGGSSRAHELLSMLGFVLKSAAIFAAMRAGARVRVVAAALGALVALALTAAWIAWEPAPEIEAALAEAMLAVLALVGVRAAYRRIASRARPGPLPAHPFL